MKTFSILRMAKDICVCIKQRHCEQLQKTSSYKQANDTSYMLNILLYLYYTKNSLHPSKKQDKKSIVILIYLSDYTSARSGGTPLLLPCYFLYDQHFVQCERDLQDSLIRLRFSVNLRLQCY